MDCPCDTRLLFVTLIALPGLLSCGDLQDLFDDDTDPPLTPYLDPDELTEPVDPACHGVDLTTSEAAPFERVDVTFDFEDFDPEYFGVEMRRDADENAEDADFFIPIRRDDQGYFFLAPAHPDGIDGGRFHLQFRDAELRCEGSKALTIAPLQRAPGTLAAIVDAAADRAHTLAQAHGYTADDLVDADAADLPGPMLPLSAQIWALNHPDNPDSLAARIATDDLPLEYTTSDLEFAEALLAASGHLQDLEQASQDIEELLADSPDIDVRFEAPINQIQPAPAQTTQSLCSHFDGMASQQISNYNELSYYMRKANRAQSHGERVARIGWAVGALGVIPGPSSIAAAIISLVFAFDTLMVNAHTSLYPRELSDPRLENFTADFNEDFDTRGDWGPYFVTATAPGWTPTADFRNALLSAVFSLATLGAVNSSIAPRVAGELKKHMDKFLSANAEKTLDNLMDGIVEHFIENITYMIYDELPVDDANCTITAGPWPDIPIHNSHWLDVAYEGGIAPIIGEQSGAACRNGPLATSPTEYEPFKTGLGRLIIKASQDHFPTAANPLGSQLIEVVDTHEIDVHVDRHRRVAYPGDTIEMEGLILNAHNQQGRWKYPDFVERLDFDAPTDGPQRLELELPQAPEAFPIPVLLSSRAYKGLRSPECDPPARAQLITIDDETDLDVFPRHRCLPEGGTLQLQADLAHPDPDAQVHWSSSAGTIDDNGFFEAPDSAGEVQIEAQVNDGELQERVTYRIGECGCFFDAQVHGGGLNLRLSNYGGLLAFEHDGSMTIKMADHDKGLGAVLQGDLRTGEFIFSITEHPEDGLAGAVTSAGDIQLVEHPDSNTIQVSFSATGAHLGEFFEVLHFGEEATVFEYTMSVDLMVPVTSGIGAMLPNDECSPP